MLVVFILFTISLLTVGVIMGRRLSTVAVPSPTEELTPLVHIDILAIQHRIALGVLRLLHQLVIVVVVYPLLIIEHGASFLARHLHRFLERRMHYYHSHKE